MTDRCKMIHLIFTKHLKGDCSVANEIKYNAEIQEKILSGIDQLANVIKSTLGPKGRNVLIQHLPGSPIITNNSATILKDFELKDYFENIGAKLMKEVATKTNDVVGDGTTTAIILAQYIVREGYKNITSGANPKELIKGIQGATQIAVAAIKRLAKPVDTFEAIEQVASIAADDAEIGKIIAQAMAKVGKTGIITVEESKGLKTTLQVKEGMHLERGYVSAEMITDKSRMVAELENPYILITDRVISNPQDIIILLGQIAERGRSLLIVAESVEGAALGMLVKNKLSGALNSVVVYPPVFGDGRKARMSDLALLTGGVFITEETGLSLRETTLDMLGNAQYVRVEKQNTVIVGGAGDKDMIAARKMALQTQIEKSEYDFDKKRLEERLAKLGNGIAIIDAGAVTETELNDKKGRIESALHAARAAVEEGIVPGGGVTYINICPAIKAYAETLSRDQKTGVMILMGSLKEPTRQIAENAGIEGVTVVNKVLRSTLGTGFDAERSEYVNMMAAGIVDPAKIVRLALQNAASVSNILLTTDAGVTSSAN